MAAYPEFGSKDIEEAVKQRREDQDDEVCSGEATQNYENEEKHDKGGELSDNEEEEEEEDSASHLPLAPLSAQCDPSTTIDPSYIIYLIRNLLPKDVEKKALNHSSGTMKDAMSVESFQDAGSHHNMVKNYENDNGNLFGDSNEIRVLNKDKGTEQEDEGAKNPWEECGCILWDLSANKTHAEFMVDNLLLEVLLANLHFDQSIRVTEICLGIIGNLACHHDLSNTIVSKNGLIDTVIQQLFLDDSTCLSETFRLLSAGLQGELFSSWAEALLPEQNLMRILWIIGNTLNPVLLEKSMEFLMTITSNQEVSNILLQPLINMGFLNLVASLLADEISKLREENTLERSRILDPILSLVEALSSMDNSQVVLSEDLFTLVCDVIKLPDKIEISSSCVSAIVAIANLIVDKPMLEFWQESMFLQGFLDIIPFVSDDLQARNAWWCVTEKILAQIQYSNHNLSFLHKFQTLFLAKSQLIVDDIENHKKEKVEGNHKCDAIATSLNIMACILEKILLEQAGYSDKQVAGSGFDDNRRIHNFLHYCLNHARLECGICTSL